MCKFNCGTSECARHSDWEAEEDRRRVKEREKRETEREGEKIEWVRDCVYVCIVRAHNKIERDETNEFVLHMNWRYRMRYGTIRGFTLFFIWLIWLLTRCLFLIFEKFSQFFSFDILIWVICYSYIAICSNSKQNRRMPTGCKKTDCGFCKSTHFRSFTGDSVSACTCASI